MEIVPPVIRRGREKIDLAGKPGYFRRRGLLTVTLGVIAPGLQLLTVRLHCREDIFEVESLVSEPAVVPQINNRGDVRACAQSPPLVMGEAFEFEPPRFKGGTCVKVAGELASLLEISE